MWRGNFHFRLQAADVHRKREHGFARKAGKQQHPRRGEIKRRVVKYALSFAIARHQLIESRHDASEHEIHVVRREDYSLRFAGRT